MNPTENWKKFFNSLPSIEGISIEEATKERERLLISSGDLIDNYFQILPFILSLPKFQSADFWTKEEIPLLKLRGEILSRVIFKGYPKSKGSNWFWREKKISLVFQPGNLSCEKEYFIFFNRDFLNFEVWQ